MEDTVTDYCGKNKATVKKKKKKKLFLRLAMKRGGGDQSDHPACSYNVDYPG